MEAFLKHRHARRARVIFYEVSEIGAFMELFTVMIWLILEIVLVAMYSKR